MSSTEIIYIENPKIIHTKNARYCTTHVQYIKKKDIYNRFDTDSSAKDIQRAGIFNANTQAFLTDLYKTNWTSFDKNTPDAVHDFLSNNLSSLLPELSENNQHLQNLVEFTQRYAHQSGLNSPMLIKLVRDLRSLETSTYDTDRRVGWEIYGQHLIITDYLTLYNIYDYKNNGLVFKFTGPNQKIPILEAETNIIYNLNDPPDAFEIKESYIKYLPEITEYLPFLVLSTSLENQDAKKHFLLLSILIRILTHLLNLFSHCMHLLKSGIFSYKTSPSSPPSRLSRSQSCPDLFLNPDTSHKTKESNFPLKHSLSMRDSNEQISYIDNISCG